MPYKITITRIDRVESVERGNWTIVSKRPFKEAEILDTPRDHRDKWAAELNEIYGYAPDRPVVREVETKILGTSRGRVADFSGDQGD